MSQFVYLYRSVDGEHYFTFRFQPRGGHFGIHVLSHPGFNGRDSGVSKTHLYPTDELCIVAGQEPRDMDRAFELAKQWAEYFLQYRITGEVQ